MARTKTQDAFGFITEVLADDTASNKERMTAASIVLDRGWGKALQGVLVQQDSAAPSTMSTAALAAQAQNLLSSVNISDDVDDAIDGDYTEVESVDTEDSA